MYKVLIIVDMQNDFVDGVLGTPEAKNIIPNVINKIKEYKKNNWAIYCTRDTHSENYLNTPEGLNLPVKHCVYKSYGWELNSDIKKELKEDPFYFIPCYDKRTFGCNELINALVKENNTEMAIDEIELVGLCTGICVMSNAIMLKNAFYDKFTNITVDASCCACVTPESHKHALEAMKLCQIRVINE